MKVLIVTNMFPFDEMDYFGNFVKTEAEEISRKVDKLDILFVNGRKNKFNYLIGALKYIICFKKYDVIHFHHSYVALYSLLGKPKRMVFTMHEGGNYYKNGNKLSVAYEHGRSKKLESLLSKFNIREKILKKSDRLILAYRSNENLNWHEKEVHCIPPGIDPSRFEGLSRKSARTALNIDEDTIFLLFPHEPRAEKNLHLFEFLVDSIKKEGHKIMHVVGGKIPFSEMPKYLAACDCFYILSEFESSPMVAKEGIFSGANLISFDLGDIRNNFEKSPNCILVRNINDAISETLKKIKSRDPLSELITEDLNHLTVNCTAAEVFALYE